MNKLIKYFIAFSFISGICVASGVLGIAWYVIQHPILDMGYVDAQLTLKPSVVLDVQGNEIARFQMDSREFVSITRIPAHVVKAFVAAEDWNFFNHTGLSFKGILRSILINLYYGKKMQGASTITQQLAKLYFFDGKKTFIRKFKEQLYALLIERQYSKEQILESYLNTVYFGSGLYGVQAAAKRFWNKNIDEVSIDQAAMLAAVICSPGNYSPLYYPLSGQKRRNVILRKMQKLGFITKEECSFAQTIPVAVCLMAPEHIGELNLTMREYIRSWVEQRYGKERLYTGGLIIQTTLDSKIQRNADAVCKDHFKKLRLKYGGDLNGALISFDCHTGAIRALVSGAGDAGDYFNRVFNAKRQQGSVFKPLVYAAALEAGMSLCDTAIDEPLEVMFEGKSWSPRNHNRMFKGLMTLARALVYSNNIVTVKTLLTVGPQKVVDLAKRCHLSGQILAYPSLGLGCVDTPLVEAAGMFNIFANDGVYVEPYLITWIKDGCGKKIYKVAVAQEQVLSAKIAHQIGQALTIGINKKRHVFKKWIDSEAMTKTGTTNDSRTCWFAGSTPEMTTLVYVGCDDNRPMGEKVFPLHTSFPIWLDFHTLLSTRQKKFRYESSLRSVYVNSITGEFVDHKDVDEVYQLLV